ncbi:alkaline phosphatase family protein [Bacillaceae bacterium Marseille-Q3522]|nr:alkaline phosphatase family protein [Bacillaceae bacterium Marseille-Q3522]
MTRLTNHLIVISFDCLSSLDFPMIENLPNFQELLIEGSFCKQVKTIYPSVTYPCHATIVTGNYPKHHGVVSNTLIQPGSPSPDWYWHRRYVKGTTLYDEAKKSGMTTAALLWPVTARANIDYHMPEIFANRKWHNQIAVSLWNGSPLYQLEMNWRFGHIRKGLSQPELDDFVLESAVQTIKAKKPDLMLIHFTDLDTQRHHHGFSSEEAASAIHRHDMRLGRIKQALKDAQIFADSTIIALGDHSALDEAKAIKLNVQLRKENLILTNQHGKVTNWKAFCKSCDGSAYIYLKDERDEETKTSVLHLLNKLAADESNGIEAVLDAEEAEKRGADPEALCMLEARKGFYFHESLHGDFLDPVTSNNRYTYATHGYSPEKEAYTTVFMAAGKGIRKNIVIEDMHLVDEGPTFAHLLGLDLGKTDGQIVKELF